MQVEDLKILLDRTERINKILSKVIAEKEKIYIENVEIQMIEVREDSAVVHYFYWQGKPDFIEAMITFSKKELGKMIKDI